MNSNSTPSHTEVDAAQLPSWASVLLNCQKITEFVVVDIETNGLEQRENQILSVGAARFINGELASSFYSLSKPELPEGIENYTTLESTSVNKITEEQVKSAPLEETVMKAFANFVGVSPIVGHNVVRFDFRFLNKALKRHRISSAFGWSMFDTFVIARSLRVFEKNSLEVVSKTLGLTNRAAHHALADCIATGEVMQFFLDNYYQKVVDSVFITDCQLKSEHLEVSPFVSTDLQNEKIVSVGWSESATKLEIAQSVVDAGGVYLHNTLAGTTKVLQGDLSREDTLIRKSSSFGSATSKMYAARSMKKKPGKKVLIKKQDTFIKDSVKPHIEELLTVDLFITVSSEKVHGVDLEENLETLWVNWDSHVKQVDAVESSSF